MIENNSKLASEVNIIRKNEITLKALILQRGLARPDVSPNLGLKLAKRFEKTLPYLLSRYSQQGFNTYQIVVVFYTSFRALLDNQITY